MRLPNVVACVPPIVFPLPFAVTIPVPVNPPSFVQLPVRSIAFAAEASVAPAAIVRSPLTVSRPAVSNVRAGACGWRTRLKYDVEVVWTRVVPPAGPPGRPYPVLA